MKEDDPLSWIDQVNAYKELVSHMVDEIWGQMFLDLAMNGTGLLKVKWDKEALEGK